jgi:hypothetical protein
VTVTGKRREDELLICLYDASPAGVILSRASACANALHAAEEDVQSGPNVVVKLALDQTAGSNSQHLLTR